MKKILILLLATLLMRATLIFAQTLPPVIDWQHSLGGSSIDNGGAIISTADGGWITIGSTMSTDHDVISNHGGYDMLVTKLDSMGSILWKKTFGGAGNDITSTRIIENANGDYTIAFATYSLWSGDINDTCWGSSDIAVLRFDAQGIVLWQKSFGGSGTEVPVALFETTTHELTVLGQTDSNDGDVMANHGSYDYWIFKLTSTGTFITQKTFGGSLNDSPWYGVMTQDGGYALFGHTYSNNGDITFNHGALDMWLVIIDSSFSTLISKTFGGTHPDYGIALAQLADGGYVLAGHTQSNDGDVTAHFGSLGYTDIWLLRLTPALTIAWEKNLGGTNLDQASAVITENDTTFVVSGWTVSNDSMVSGNHGTADVWLVAVDADGKFRWQKCLGGTGDDAEDYGGEALVATRDGGCIVVANAHSIDGDLSFNYGSTDIWVVKLKPAFVPDTTDTTSTVIVSEVPLPFIACYPNPANDMVTVSSNVSIRTIFLYDMLGRKIMTLSFGHDVSILVTLNVETLISGMYLCVVETPNGNTSIPFVVRRL